MKPPVVWDSRHPGERAQDPPQLPGRELALDPAFQQRPAYVGEAWGVVLESGLGKIVIDPMVGTLRPVHLCIDPLGRLTDEILSLGRIMLGLLLLQKRGERRGGHHA